MLDRIRPLLKDTALYGAGDIAVRALAFLILPVVTRIFLPADYGILELTATAASILGAFLMLGISSGAQQMYFDHKDPEIQAEYISSGLWFLLAWSAVGTAVLLAAGRPLSAILYGAEHPAYLRLALLALPCTLVIAYCKDVLRLQFAPGRFALVSVVAGFLGLGLSLYLCLVHGYALRGYLTGALVGAAVAATLAILFIRRDLRLRFSRSRWREMFGLGIGLVPAGFAYLVFDVSDRFFLRAYASLTEVGLYSLAIRVSGLMQLPLLAFAQAWSPYAYKYRQESGHQEFFRRAFLYVLVLFSGFALLLTAVAEEIIRVMTPGAYHGAGAAVGPLALALVAQASTQVSMLGICFARKTWFLSLHAGITAAANLGLNFLLIPRYGAVGAAVATALSYFLLTGLFAWQGERCYPLGLEGLRAARVLALAALGVAGLSLMPEMHPAVAIVVKLAAAGGWGVFVLYVSLTAPERERLWVLLRRPIGPGPAAGPADPAKMLDPALVPGDNAPGPAGSRTQA